MWGVGTQTLDSGHEDVSVGFHLMLREMFHSLM